MVSGRASDSKLSAPYSHSQLYPELRDYRVIKKGVFVEESLKSEVQFPILHPHSQSLQLDVLGKETGL